MSLLYFGASDHILSIHAMIGFVNDIYLQIILMFIYVESDIMKRMTIRR